jgi:hypothetical protein
VMVSVGLADFPAIYANGYREQYLHQGENTLHEDRLRAGEVPLSSSKTIGDHVGIRQQTSTDVPEWRFVFRNAF